MKNIKSIVLAFALLFISLVSLDVKAASNDNLEIISFDVLSDEDKAIYISKNNKPTLEQLVQVMPENLVIFTEKGQILLPVSWECVGENFEETDSYYYQFSPVWDDNRICLSESLKLYRDLPYISVFLYEDDYGLAESSVTNSRNEAIIFKFLVNEMNFNSAVASGILANMYHESSFNPNALGDNGTSYGICQWHNSRWESLKNWCNSNGYDWTTLNGQLNYLKFELSKNNYQYLWNGRTIYSNLLAIENTAEGAYYAGWYWCYYYEIPQNKDTVAVTRGNLSRDTYWPEYKDYLFDDIELSYWAYPYIKNVYEKNIMNGTGDGTTFSPLDNLTREQFAVILYRLDNSPEVEYSGMFSDVPDNTWYTDAVLWANQVGVVKGYDNGKFGTGDNITREQLAIMLYRFAEYNGKNVDESADLTSFTDASSVDFWADKEMKWAVSVGLINGKSNNMLDPLGMATRAECATIITRYLDLD